MANPLIKEYFTIRTALQRRFNKTKISELTENERKLTFTSRELHAWPTITLFTYYDYMTCGDVILESNMAKVMRQLNKQESDVYAEPELITSNLYNWLISYVRYAHRVLYAIGYNDVQPDGIEFTDPGRITPILIGPDDPDDLFMIEPPESQNLEAPSESPLSTNDDEEEFDESGITNVMDESRIIPSRDSILLLDDPEIHGIKADSILAIKDLNDDIAIISKARILLILKPIPRLTSIKIGLSSGVFRTGQNYNELLSNMWMGNITDHMRQMAVATCLRVLRLYAYVPTLSRAVLTHRTTDRNRNVWNAKTTAIFYFSALFIVVFDLQAQGKLTKHVVNSAYEIVMRILDYPVQKERVYFSATHTYCDKKFNYSLNDLANQLKIFDWAGIFWNYLCEGEDVTTDPHIFVWIKLMLMRAGDAHLKVEKNQIVTPAPFTKQFFIKNKPGTIVFKDTFREEVKKLSYRPADLEPNDITEVTYSYPGTGHWNSDAGDRFDVPKAAQFLIVYTALLLDREYSIDDLIDLVRNG